MGESAVGTNYIGSQADNQKPAVCNQMPHNTWLQETRRIAASCFAPIQGADWIIIYDFRTGCVSLCHNFARTICHYVFESVKSTG